MTEFLHEVTRISQGEHLQGQWTTKRHVRMSQGDVMTREHREAIKSQCMFKIRLSCQSKENFVASERGKSIYRWLSKKDKKIFFEGCWEWSHEHMKAVGQNPILTSTSFVNMSTYIDFILHLITGSWYFWEKRNTVTNNTCNLKSDSMITKWINIVRLKKARSERSQECLLCKWYKHR